MDWDDVRYFLTLVRLGSLSASARAMKVEHSTVSRRIGQLESDLGIRLFDRFARGWTLTPEGEQLLGRAEAMEQEALALRRAAIDGQSMQGPVRLSAPPILLNHLLLPRLTSLKGKHPGLRLTLAGESHRARLHAGEADLAVRLEHPGESTLVARSLGDVGYAFYGNFETTGWKESDRRFVGFDETSGRSVLSHWFDVHVPQNRVALRCSDFETMASAAREGWGLALLPRFFARHLEGLIEVSHGAECPRRSAFLVFHSDVRKAPRVRAVADEIVTAFRDGQPLL